MDYAVPRADDLPSIECEHLEYRSPRNPLGAKGLGEGGAISPPAAIANAIDDALAPLGIRVTATPALPSRIHRLIEERSHAMVVAGTASPASDVGGLFQKVRGSARRSP
jgi:carbon-monoxide dehydrogenase large subunit